MSLDAYQKLKSLSTEIHHFSSALGLLHWDKETHMPPNGIGPRGHQIALLASHIHELKTGKTYRTLLKTLSSKRALANLSPLERVAVREWRRDFKREFQLPAKWVRAMAHTTAEASHIWQIAREQNNFALFAPHLQKIIDLNREKAAIYGYKDHPYDALLAGYECSISTTKVKQLFTGLKKELKALLEKILNSSRKQMHASKKSYDLTKQMQLGHTLLKILPVDHHSIKLDLSAHPFSESLHPHDARITTRLSLENPFSNLFSILHEAGHAMYEMGLPVDQWGTPLAEAVSLSIHESQSRWWEVWIGRSLSFWEFFYPEVKKAFPKTFQTMSLKSFYRNLHTITPSLIRVEADEVTYCLHVILRFEIELELITGHLKVIDLPERWNETMRELLGIAPPDDRQGCLQDIHWSLGDFGYFPTYALGNLCAAQFFTAFVKEHPTWEERVRQGDLHFIRSWLQTNIHQFGKQYNTDQLVKRVTGSSLSEKPFCRYLKAKYETINLLRN